MSNPPHPQDREALIARYGDRYRWQVMGVITLGIIAGILPSGSFVVAIPAVLEAFHAGHVEAQLIMTAFIVANTIAMLPTPWLVQRFGMRKCFIWSMVMVTVSSILGALSPNFAFLVAVRALQGASAGILLPMGSIAMMRLFAPHQQGRAAGLMSLSITLAPALAPTIGGLMVDHWGWRTISLMPVPVCLVALFLTLRFMPIARGNERQSFDGISMLLLSLMVLAWLGGLSTLGYMGRGNYWLPASLALMAGAVLAFFIHARRRAHPLIGLELLKNRRVMMGSLFTFGLGFSATGSAYLVPLYVQVAQGMDATHAGAALMPGTLMLALSFGLGGYLADTWSGQKVMVLGSVVFVLGWIALGALVTHLSYAWFVVMLMVSRLGNGLASTPTNPATMAGLQGPAIGQAATVLGIARQLGGIFSIAFIAEFTNWRTQFLGGSPAAVLQSYGEVFILSAVIFAVFSLTLFSLDDVRRRAR